MTVEQILMEIYKNDCVDEVFLALSKRMIADKENMEKTIAENSATLRLIGKVTKDKTVKDILADD